MATRVTDGARRERHEKSSLSFFCSPHSCIALTKSEGKKRLLAVYARNKRLDYFGLRHAFLPYEGGFRDELKERLRGLVRSRCFRSSHHPQWFDSLDSLCRWSFKGVLTYLIVMLSASSVGGVSKRLLLMLKGSY